MKKISVVFQHDHTREVLVPEVRPGCEWVTEGQGVATLKVDGSACLWQDNRLWKRYDRKLNKQAQRRRDRGENLDGTDLTLFKEAPAGFMPCEASPDPVSLHWPGWLPVSATAPEDVWHREALANNSMPLVDGATYELVGPHLSLNPYALASHELWRHGEVVDVPDRSFEGLRAFLETLKGEGLVFHHPDGRMAKLRRKDFGMFWVQDEPKRRSRMNPR